MAPLRWKNCKNTTRGKGSSMKRRTYTHVIRTISYRVLRDIDTFTRICQPDASRLARGHGHRHELLQVCTFCRWHSCFAYRPIWQIANTLGLGEEPRILEALHVDEEMMVLSVRQLVREASGQKSAQDLCGEDAQLFLDLVQDVSESVEQSVARAPYLPTSPDSGPCIRPSRLPSYFLAKGEVQEETSSRHYSISTSLR